MAFKHSTCVVLALVSLVCLVSPASAGNRYPIILVNGFAGWGPDELAGVKYWGGIHGDYAERLNAHGYDVRTAVVGPFSSNWDRACDLYAYIKGGCVHYGNNHAAVYGHNATGRCYPGIYPQWGEIVNGEVQKIHLIGHSMGGQTSRMLAQLLAHGSKGAPVEEDPKSHPLFAGGKADWVHSITTISTPNQGTLLANGFSVIGDLVEGAAAAMLGLAGSIGDASTLLYDAKLDHWGIGAKQRGESMKSYVKRIFGSGLFDPGFKDISLFSLSTFGAKEDLTWVQTLPNIFYYSFSTSDTFRLLNVHLPRVHSMFLPFQATGTFLGSKYALKNGFTRDWQANDGVVNTVSMTHDGRAQVVEGGGESRSGRWHHLGLFKTLDHGAIIGFKLFNDVFGIFKTHARFLYDLPAPHQANRRLEDGSIVHTTSSQIVDSFDTLLTEMNVVDELEDIRAACNATSDQAILELCAEFAITLEQVDVNA